MKGKRRGYNDGQKLLTMAWELSTPRWTTIKFGVRILITIIIKTFPRDFDG